MLNGNTNLLTADTAVAIQQRESDYLAQMVIPATQPGDSYFAKSDGIAGLTAGPLAISGEFVGTDAELSNAQTRQLNMPEPLSIYDVRNGDRWNRQG